MQFTLFSFISAAIWSNAFLIAICFIRKANKPKRYAGILSVSLLYLLGLFRMIFPLEFDRTIVLESPNICSALYRFLYDKWILGFSPISILVCIWLGGACWLLIRYVMDYRKAIQQIVNYAIPCCIQEQDVLDRVKHLTHQLISVSLVKCSYIDTPIGLGILKRYIVLPDCSYRDNELYYILLHEYTHFMHKDLIIKFLFSIFCIVFWWNPVVYLLKEDLEQTLEIRCDLHVTKKFNTLQKKEYLRTIVNVLKRASAQQQQPYAFAALLKQTRSNYIEERFETVLYYKSTSIQKACSAAFGLLGIVLLITSYVFVPKPSFKAPDSTNGIDTFEFDQSNAYIKKSTSGCYWLVIEDSKQEEISAQEAVFFKNEGFILKEE